MGRASLPVLPLTSVLVVAMVVVLALVGLGPDPDGGDVESGDGPIPRERAPMVRIPSEEIGPEARFFSYPSGGVEVRFFAYSTQDGSVHVAMDACDTCYPARKGFHEENATMQCNSCGKLFDMGGIGKVLGECWPAPVPSKLEGDEVLIPVETLKEGAYLFA